MGLFENHNSFIKNLVIAESNEKFEKASHVVPGTVYPFLRGVGLTALRIGSNPIMGICQKRQKNYTQKLGESHKISSIYKVRRIGKYYD